MMVKEIAIIFFRMIVVIIRRYIIVGETGLPSFIVKQITVEAIISQCLSCPRLIFQYHHSNNVKIIFLPVINLFS
jgi:hypothetical protein